jgi:hypothetical protein
MLIALDMEGVMIFRASNENRVDNSSGLFNVVIKHLEVVVIRQHDSGGVVYTKFPTLHHYPRETR